MELREKLCNAFGPSGYEDEVREMIKSEIAQYADKVFTDRIGNLCALVKGKKKGNTLVASAHMDEVGFMIRFIGEEGELYFETIGGIDPSVIPNKRVVIGKNRIPGIISAKAIHLQSAEERKKVTKVDKMYMDIGAASREEAASLVSVGDVAVFLPNYENFGDGFVKSKAIDDRFGCAALIEAMKNGVEYDTYFAFVTREEIGCRGASCVAYLLNPDIAVVAEGTTAADIAGVPASERVCVLGEGPTLSFMDNATVYDVGLFKKIRALADGRGLKYQVKNLVAGGNDSSAYQRGAAGAKTVAVSVPTRYIHSASSVAKVSDLEGAAALISAIINDKTIREDTENA